MKLKDLHEDVERFLEYECYTPNEFYSFNGFERLVFDKNTEVEFLGETINMIACIEKKSEPGKNQILVLWKNEEEDIITDSLHFDATKNNIKLTKEYLLKDYKKLDASKFNTFIPIENK